MSVLPQKVRHHGWHVLSQIERVIEQEVHIFRPVAPLPVVVLPKVIIQSMNTFDWHFARPLNGEDLSCVHNSLQSFQQVRRNFTFNQDIRTKDNIIFQSFPCEDLFILKNVRGKTGSHTGHPQAFHLERSLVLLGLPDEFRLAAVMNGDAFVSAIAGQQQISVRYGHPSRDIPNRIRVIDVKRLMRSRMYLEEAQSFHFL